MSELDAVLFANEAFYRAFADRDIAVFGRTGVGRAAGLVVRNVRAQDFSIYVDATHARYAQKLLHTCAGAEI